MENEFKSEPYFTHDCVKCNYLGRIFSSYNTTQMSRNDLYYCPSTNSVGSLIARYGNEGSEYTSAPVRIVAFDIPRDDSNGNENPLWRAFTEAIRRGFITVKLNETKVYF